MDLLYLALQTQHLHAKPVAFLLAAPMTAVRRADRFGVTLFGVRHPFIRQLLRIEDLAASEATSVA